MKQKAWEKTLNQKGTEHRTFAPGLVLLPGMEEGGKKFRFQKVFLSKTELKLENV